MDGVRLLRSLIFPEVLDRPIAPAAMNKLRNEPGLRELGEKFGHVDGVGRQQPHLQLEGVPLKDASLALLR